MKQIKPKFLAVKVAALVVALGTATMPVHSITVIDVANLRQNIMIAIESVSQTAKQIQLYQTQLLQYENMLKNTMAPAAYIWDQAQRTIDDLNQATNTLAYYRNQLGSLDAYLGKFQDVAYYRSSPCFSSQGCSDAERAKLAESRRLASEAQKKAIDAVFRGLNQQHDNLAADARQLSRLQSGAQSAAGQLAAIGYANQLASHQANQLLQIRALLIAQQNAVITRMQAEADKEAQQQAASARLRKNRMINSPGKSWGSSDLR